MFARTTKTMSDVHTTLPVVKTLKEEGVRMIAIPDRIPHGRSSCGRMPRAATTFAALLAVAVPVTQSHAQQASVIRESFVRVFVAPDKFVPTIKSYMATTGGRCSMHFPFPERKLELAAVVSPHTSFLIIAGEPDALERFRGTFVTFHVTDLNAAINAATKGGAAVLQQRTEVPTGLQARVRTPDGLTIELVEHNEAARRFYHCRDLPLD